MSPVWRAAGRRLSRELGAAHTPHLALGAAFCFTIQMFNIPLLGGTTVHPAGGVLLAILLGPWAAVVGMTVVLAMQALFFGDGGVLAIGANSFTMAFTAPVVGCLAYRALCGSSPSTARRLWSAGIGAYTGSAASALVTAIILGIQPAFFHDAAGRALYFPFGLKVTLPAIMSAHLTVAGIAESLVTIAALRCAVALRIPIYGADQSRSEGRITLAWTALAALIALSPVGLLASGSAWGESGLQEPAWNGFNLLPDYLRESGPPGYIGAAAAGVLLVSAAIWFLGRLILRPANPTHPAPRGPRPSKSPTDIPEWLRQGPGSYTPSRRAPLRALAFSDRTIGALAESAHHTLLSEQYARAGGLLQRLDPRAKTIAALLIVLAVSQSHSFPMLIGVSALAAFLALLSQVPLLVFLNRAWLSAPLFAGVVLLPAALNVVTPGRPVFNLSSNPYLAVTDAGLLAVALLTLRIGAALSVVALLPLTTPWPNLLRGLRALGIPRPFIAVLSMTYRYTAVLMRTAADTCAARRSRSLGRIKASADRKYVGRVSGVILQKAHSLSLEIHAAMLSRGWTGESRTLVSPRLTAADALLLTGAGSIAAMMVFGERLGG